MDNYNDLMSMDVLELRPIYGKDNRRRRTFLQGIKDLIVPHGKVQNMDAENHKEEPLSSKKN